MKTFLTAVVLAIGFSEVNAEEITGGFGIPFDQPFSESIKILKEDKIIWSAESSAGERWQLYLDSLDVVPPEPNSIFRDYRVSITPTSRLPFMIYAQSKMDRSACLSTESAVLRILKEKYPNAKFRKGHFNDIKSFQ
ncbi:hypothetical protein [Ruegeria sp. HKCCA5929]|uniref:hypothetical protein n=1 Tax=Ruegeria sp. HKCCA5929 TaxID=2682988 RepID=UPI0014882F4A|nr:hypothetical protein [Ruegeria sp. HKCCA5929]